MQIVCISAANIEAARNNSASARACQVVRDLPYTELPEAEVEIISLIDCELKSCRMCGACHPGGRCARDAAFSQILAKLTGADGVFLGRLRPLQPAL